MKDQVLSIERMQHLKELGVDTSKGGIYWVRFRAYNWFLSLHTDESLEIVPAFTLQDILNLLPSTIDVKNQDEINEYWIEFGTSERNKSYWFVQYRSIDDSIYVIRDKESLIDAAYEMLLWCIYEGYIKTNKED